MKKIKEENHHAHIGNVYVKNVEKHFLHLLCQSPKFFLVAAQGDIKMLKLNMIQRDIKLIKVVRAVNRIAKICSFGMIALISSVIFLDVLKELK